MRGTRRLASALVISTALVAVPTASAALPLRMGQAKHYLAKAERQSSAETPEYSAFQISSCRRLTSTKVNCALSRWFESAEYPVFECRSRVDDLRAARVRALQVHAQGGLRPLPGSVVAPPGLAHVAFGDAFARSG